MALLGETRGVGVVHRVVAGEHVPVRTVLDRIFADEAAEVGGVPALALLLQARRRVEQAAVVGEGRHHARCISQAVGAERRRHPAELGVVERLTDVRRVLEVMRQDDARRVLVVAQRKQQVDLRLQRGIAGRVEELIEQDFARWAVSEGSQCILAERAAFQQLSMARRE